MKRKLLIDVTVLAQGVKTGIYRVTDEVVKFLVQDESLEVFFTLTQEAFFTANALDLRAGLLAYSTETGVSAPFIDSEIDPAFTDIDIYVSTFFQVPERWAHEERVQKAVFAYDLIPILHPEYCEETTTGIVSEFYSQIGKDWQVFAISASTKADLLQHRPDLDPQNVIVLPLGVEAKFSADIADDDVAATKEKYHIPADKPYILSVATLEIRKNLIAVLDAYAQYLERFRDDRTQLVLTGMKGWKLDHLNAEIEKRPLLTGRVILTGFVAEQDLPALYAGASVFVFMSFYEGFGLPPLEAMGSGVPVICSNTSSLPEVVADAGILLAPTDIEGISTALERILSDDDLHARLSQAAMQRAALFSWESCCTAFVERLSSLQLSPLPYLSIITICFNEASIRDTCQSVAKQTCNRFEWVVVDGASDAATLEVLHEYREHMATLISEPDEGRYDAMNKGIAKSRGKYLLFLNGGDYLEQADTLEKIFSYSVPFAMMNLFPLKLNAPVVYGEVIARETGLMPYPLWKTGEQCHDMTFFSGNSLPHQATFIAKSLFEKYGLYNTDLQYAADYEWFIRVLVHYREASQYLPAVVSVYNFEGASSASVEPDAPHMLEIQAVYKHYAAFAKAPWGEAVTSHGPDINDYKHQLAEAKSKLKTAEGAVLLEWLTLLQLNKKSDGNHYISPISVHDEGSAEFSSFLHDIHRWLLITEEKLSAVELTNYMRCLAYLSEALQDMPFDADSSSAKEALLSAMTSNAAGQGDFAAVISLAYWRYRGRLPREREMKRWKSCMENGVSIEAFLSRLKAGPRSREYQAQYGTLHRFAREQGLQIGEVAGSDRYALMQQALRGSARRNKFFQGVKCV